jgi:hypothetical protein
METSAPSNPEENMIVKKESYCSVVEGTEDICICNRICHGFTKAEGDPYFKQLFVARSVGLCNVEGVVGSELSGDGRRDEGTTYSTG